jgi:hypothetical protein
MDDEELKDREALRRKALWTLAHLAPGDPSAPAVIHVVDEVEKREQLADLSALSLDDLGKAVQAEPRPIGYPIVRDTEIPQPWRERFQRASIGSTRAPEGAYAHDWQKFLSE